MPTVYAKYTEQPYFGTEGKVLLADRVYFAAPATAHPTVAAAGATPAGWADAGSIDNSLVALAKADPTIIPVTTGLYEILRAEVATKDGDVTATFTIDEYEPATWANITGDATIAVGAGTAIYTGGRPIIQKAILLVGQNPVTGKEFHHYNPKSDISYKIQETDRFRTIGVSVHFLKFTDVADAASLARDFKLIVF